MRNRLQYFLDAMQAAETRPWEPLIVRQRRERVIPYLYERLPDRAEADEWRVRIDAEIARLDAAAA